MAFGGQPPVEIVSINPETLSNINKMAAGVRDLTGKMKDGAKAAQGITVQLAAVGAVANKLSNQVNKLASSLVSAGKEMIMLSINATETANKFDVVFKGVARVEQNLALLRNEFGLSNETAKRLLGSVGDLAAGLGLTGEQAFGFALQVAKLGGDLASFQNIEGGVEEATERLARGLLGHTRNLRLLGIMVKKTDKDYQKLVKTLVVEQRWTQRQAETLALLEMAYKQSPNAINDFARTTLNAANQIRILDENTKELKTTFGNFAAGFLHVDKVLLGLNMVIEATIGWWKSLNKEVKSWIMVGALIATGLALLTAAFFAVLTAAIGAALAIGALIAIGLPAAVIISVIIGIFSTLVAAVSAVAVAVAALFYDLGEGEGVWERIQSGIMKTIGFLYNWRQNLMATADTAYIWADAIATIFEDMVANVFIWVDNLLTRLGNIPEALKALFTDGMDEAKKALDNGTNDMLDISDNAAKKLEELGNVEFTTDLAGLKKRFADLRKIGQGMLGKGAGTRVPQVKLAPSGVEGSAEAYKIIAMADKEDLAAANAEANKKTARNTDEIVKKFKPAKPAVFA